MNNSSDAHTSTKESPTPDKALRRDHENWDRKHEEINYKSSNVATVQCEESTKRWMCLGEKDALSGSKKLQNIDYNVESVKQQIEKEKDTDILIEKKFAPDNEEINYISIENEDIIGDKVSIVPIDSEKTAFDYLVPGNTSYQVDTIDEYTLANECLSSVNVHNNDYGNGVARNNEENIDKESKIVKLSCKGSTKKIQYQGYIYSSDNPGAQNRLRWRCLVKVEGKYCAGRLLTSKKYEIISSKGHKHPPQMNIANLNISKRIKQIDCDVENIQTQTVERETNINVTEILIMEKDPPHTTKTKLSPENEHIAEKEVDILQRISVGKLEQDIVHKISTNKNNQHEISEVIDNIKQGEILNYLGYSYSPEKRKLSTKQLWQCTQAKHGCHGRLTIHPKTKKAINFKDHSHEPENQPKEFQELATSNTKQIPHRDKVLLSESEFISLFSQVPKYDTCAGLSNAENQLEQNLIHKVPGDTSYSAEKRGVLNNPSNKYTSRKDIVSSTDALNNHLMVFGKNLKGQKMLHHLHRTYIEGTQVEGKNKQLWICTHFQKLCYGSLKVSNKRMILNHIPHATHCKPKSLKIQSKREYNSSKKQVINSITGEREFQQHIGESFGSLVECRSSKDDDTKSVIDDLEAPPMNDEADAAKSTEEVNCQLGLPKSPNTKRQMEQRKVNESHIEVNVVIKNNVNTVLQATKEYSHASDNSLEDASNEEKVNCLQIEIGSLVWVKIKKSRPWPAIVVEAEKCGLPPSSSPSRVMVFWLGDGRYTNVNRTDVSDITQYRERYWISKDPQYQNAVCQVLKYASERASEIKCHIAEDFESLIEWAKEALKQPPATFRPRPGHPTYPLKVLHCLQRIHKYNQSNTDQGKREWKKKGLLLREVRMNRLCLEDICISCPNTEVKITAKHPIFIGGTCQSCEEDLQLDEMLHDEADGKNMWCAVCAQPGPVHACGNLNCERVICINCIRIFNGEKELQKIKSTPEEEWRCYACTDSDGLLKIRNCATIKNKVQGMSEGETSNNCQRFGSDDPFVIVSDSDDTSIDRSSNLPEVKFRPFSDRGQMRSSSVQSSQQELPDHEATSVQENKFKLQHGTIIWCKIQGEPYWPAIIIESGKSCGMDPLTKEETYIVWYQSSSIPECINEAVDKVPIKDIWAFNDLAGVGTEVFSSSDPLYRESVGEAIKDCSERSNVSLRKIGFYASESPYESLVGWFKGSTDKNIIHPKPDGDQYPYKIENILTVRKIMQEKERISWKKKDELLKLVKSGKKCIDSICICCPEVYNPIVDKHEEFCGGLCANCSNMLKCVKQIIKSDMNKYCRICGSTQDVSMCPLKCQRGYCRICVRHLAKGTKELKCFVCQPYKEETHGLIKDRSLDENVETQMNKKCLKKVIKDRSLDENVESKTNIQISNKRKHELDVNIKKKKRIEKENGNILGKRKEPEKNPIPVKRKEKENSPIPFKRKVNNDFLNSAGPSERFTNLACSDIQPNSDESSLDSFSDDVSSTEVSSTEVSSTEVSSTVVSSTEVTDSLNHKDITPKAYGALVWAQFKNFKPSPSPAIIIDHKYTVSEPPKGNACIFWLGYNQVGDISMRDTVDFLKHFDRQYTQRTSDKEYKRGVFQALQECHQRAGSKVSSNIDSNDVKSLKLWAQKGFPLRDGNLNDLRTKVGASYLSSYVPQYLSVINKAETYRKAQEWKKKMDLINEVRNDKGDIERVCITCPDVGLPVITEHPIFEGGLCSTCKADREFMDKNTDDEYKTNLCCICVRPGDIVICCTCPKGYCESCLRLLVGPKEYRKVEKLDPWECYLHNEDDDDNDSSCLIRKRENWEENTTAIADVPLFQPPIDETPDISTFMPRRKIKILSLFDGIGAGLVALHKLGIQVKECYASEVDESAINVTSVQFSMESQNNKQQTQFIHVGDVENYTKEMIKKQGPFDLLVGGSPCNDLANVNPRRRGLFDPASSGQLFFHYFRILKEIQAVQGSQTHLFWLFENVFHMPGSFKEQINKFLGSHPVLVDAQYFTAMRRKRYFWGNIPGMYDPLPDEVLSSAPQLQNYLSKKQGRIAMVSQLKTVTTNKDCYKIGGNVEYPIKDGDTFSLPWIRELEDLFGFPQSWTDVGNLPSHERKAQLARSWCVTVIEYLLKPLKKYFLTDDAFKPTQQIVADVHYNKSQNTLRSKASKVDTSLQQQSISAISNNQHQLQSNSGRQSSQLNPKDVSSSTLVDSTELRLSETEAQILSNLPLVRQESGEKHVKEELEVIDLSDSDREEMEIDTRPLDGSTASLGDSPRARSTSRSPSTSRPNTPPIFRHTRTSPIVDVPRPRDTSPNAPSFQQMKTSQKNKLASRPSTTFPSLPKFDEFGYDSKEEDEELELPDLNDTTSDSSGPSPGMKYNFSKVNLSNKVAGVLNSINEIPSTSNISPLKVSSPSSNKSGDSNFIPGIRILSPTEISNKLEVPKGLPTTEPLAKSNNDINRNVNSHGETLLIKACMHNKLEEVRSLLLVPGIDVNLTDNAGWTALHEAALKNDVDCMQLLLDHKPHEESFQCDIAKKGDGGMTALHDAVKEGNTEAAKMLLVYGGEKLLDIPNDEKCCPYDLAEDETMKDLLRSYKGKLGKLENVLLSKKPRPLRGLRLS